MNQLQTHKAALFQWHQLIAEACDYAGIELRPEVESYLLLTLIRYIHDDTLADEAVEMSSMKPLNIARSFQQIKCDAEHCLILAGLFPIHIERQALRINHYIQRGRADYLALAELSPLQDQQLYNQLANDFVTLIDVLYILRSFNGAPTLPLLQAMELWSDTGSKSAYLTLTANRQCLPLSESLSNLAYKH